MSVPGQASSALTTFCARRMRLRCMSIRSGTGGTDVSQDARLKASSCIWRMASEFCGRPRSRSLAYSFAAACIAASPSSWRGCPLVPSFSMTRLASVSSHQMRSRLAPGMPRCTSSCSCRTGSRSSASRHISRRSPSRTPGSSACKTCSNSSQALACRRSRHSMYGTAFASSSAWRRAWSFGASGAGGRAPLRATGFGFTRLGL
mmetsp:Transcript_15718/g.40485  ORF Transcript_15718/g.40485 Transcript_15718/m.40485 type:complete len:204 (-) Transcript_15718:281-892(-)